MNPTLISYYTNDPYYRSCANNLRLSCEKLNIPIIIDNLEGLGSYWKNTLLKPSYILNKLKELKRDLIWIDVDTRINEYPDCFKIWECDILAASHTGDLHGIKASPIGIKYNDRSIDLITKWEKISRSKIESNDVDLDHDILKYELLPLVKENISIEIMKGSGKTYTDFTNGIIIDNGISRSPNKAREMQIVINKNKSRELDFNNLTINNFKII